MQQAATTVRSCRGRAGSAATGSGGDGRHAMPLAPHLLRRLKLHDPPALGPAILVANNVGVHDIACLPELVLEVLPARPPGQVRHIHCMRWGARRPSAGWAACLQLRQRHRPGGGRISSALTPPAHPHHVLTLCTQGWGRKSGQGKGHCMAHPPPPAAMVPLKPSCSSAVPATTPNRQECLLRGRQEAR